MGRYESDADDYLVMYEIVGQGLPKGVVKERMIKFYNSLVGTSKFVPSEENPKTFCGSCIQRVHGSLWKWYHDPNTDLSLEVEFTGQYGFRSFPIYKKK